MKERSQLFVALAGLAVVVAGAAAYANSLSGQFLFDDTGSITDNRTIRTLWPPWKPLRPPPQITVSGRPVVNLSLAVNYALGGLDVRGYHAFNVAVHVLAALTLMGIVRRTLAGGRKQVASGLVPPPSAVCLGVRGSSKCRESQSGAPAAPPSQEAAWGWHGASRRHEALRAAATPLAFVVAMIWMLHPIQTECVSYVVQRVESVMGLFYLLTLYCAIRGMQGGARGWQAAAVACCAMGMASKEVMVSAPIFVLLYDRALAAGTFREALRRRWPLYLGLAGTWGVLALVTATTTRGDSAGFGLGVSAADYLKTQAGVVLHYLRLAFWPEGLALDYHWPIAQAFPQYAAQAAAVAALLAATGVGLWRNRPWGLLGAWFFLILGPTSSVLPIVTEIVAEHRMYLPLAAVVCGVVLGAFHAGERFVQWVPRLTAWAKGAGLAGALAAIVAMACLTAARNEDYRTPAAMWNDDVRKQPLCVRAWCAVGKTMEDANDPAGAMELYRKAMAMEPNSHIPPGFAGGLLVRQQKYREALPYFEWITAHYPLNAEAWCNAGFVLLAMNRPVEALGPLRRAVELKGYDPVFRHNYAAALARVQMYDEAVAQYERAIELVPDNPLLHEEKGKVLADAGRFAEAARAYRDSLDVQPDLGEAMGQLAWLLATCPEAGIRNGREAVEIAKRLCGHPGGKTAGNLCILAAACAEVGDFDLAARTMQSAMDAAGPKPGASQDVFRQYMDLYRSGRPLRVSAPRGE